jgi:hypothetical protein
VPVRGIAHLAKEGPIKRGGREKQMQHPLLQGQVMRQLVFIFDNVRYHICCPLLRSDVGCGGTVPLAQAVLYSSETVKGIEIR